MSTQPVSSLRIGVIGDYDANFPPHVATNAALKHVAQALGIDIEANWIATDGVPPLVAEIATTHHGFWIAPGSPYRSMDGALRVIQYAREQGIPLLGTCGGFQHIVLEYARAVLHFKDAQHAEYDPYASTLFVTPLSCALAGKKMGITIQEGSLAHKFYRATHIEEQYYCNFGLNPAYQGALEEGGLKISGADDDGEARIVELPHHRFFIGTLFVPQILSTPQQPHPLLLAYVQSAAQAMHLTKENSSTS
jgi:CTP synthase (UTP-ammonia lyase)